MKRNAIYSPEKLNQVCKLHSPKYKQYMCVANSSLLQIQSKRLQDIKVGMVSYYLKIPLPLNPRTNLSKEKQQTETKIQDILEFRSFSIFIWNAVVSLFLNVLGCILLSKTTIAKSFIGVISPDIVPRTTWCSLWSLDIVHISRRIVWSRKWMSIWTWRVNLLGLTSDPKQPKHKSS